MNIAWAWAVLAEVTPWLLRFTIAGALVTALAHVLGSTVLRHLAIARVGVWRLTVVALLVVPVLSLALPGRWTLPGGFIVLRPSGLEPVQVLSPFPGLTELVQAAPAAAAAPAPAPASEAVPTVQTSPAPVETHLTVAPPVAADVTSLPQPGSLLPGLVPGPIEPFGAAALMWITVAGWFLLQLLAGLIALDLHARRAANVTREMFPLLPEHAKRRGVQVLRGGPFRVPVCWGVLNPRILLPYASIRWTQPRLQAVLIHEAAHVERRDGLFLILARIACAVHWINPLAWGLLRRLSIDAEAACDSAVLRAGVPPRYYARVLVDVASEARSSRRPEAAMALALLRTGTLTWRVTRILDPRAMAPVARWVTNSAAAVLLIGTLVGATVTLEPERAVPEQPAETTEPAPAAEELGSVYHQLNLVSPEQITPEDPRAWLEASTALADEDARAYRAPMTLEPLEITAVPDRDAGALLQNGLSVIEDGVSRAALEIPALRPPPVSPRPRTAVAMPRRAPRVTGTLVEEGSARPIQLAQVSLVDARSGATVTGVITDKNGRFSLAAPSAGSFFLHASALGYEETTTDVTVVGDVGLTFPIRPTPVALSGLEVLKESALSASGFYDRKELGMGRFFGPMDIAGANTLRVSDLLTTVPRLYVLPDSDGSRVLMAGPMGRCGPRIILDGMLVSVDGREIDKYLSMSSLDGLEVYQSAVQVPVQWSGSLTERAPCGAIVAWTKK